MRKSIKSFIRNKLIPSKISEEEKDILMLRCSRVIIDVLVLLSLILLIFLVIVLPFAKIFNVFSTILWIVMLILIYTMLGYTLSEIFVKPILRFAHHIGNYLHFYLCSVRGEAITLLKFKKIAKDNEYLLPTIINLKDDNKGDYSLFVCQNILKILEHGQLQFWAIKNLNLVKEEAATYILHAIYVYNDWCFDTYSKQQYPVEDAIKAFKAEVYPKAFSYNEVSSLSRRDFKALVFEDLKTWCILNDCYENIFKEEENWIG